MKKDRKLNRISRKHDRETICDKIRGQAPVGMNNELITHADNTKSLILKDDHKVAFAYIEMRNNTATMIAIPGEPFFFKARNRNINRYLDIALSSSRKAIDNTTDGFIQLEPHSKMNSSFAKTLEDAIGRRNNVEVVSVVDEIIENLKLNNPRMRALFPQS